MKQRIDKLIHGRKNIFVIGACIFLVVGAATGTLLQKLNPRQHSQTETPSYQVETGAEIPVPDVPVNISFENIPDDSFLPPQTGKMIRANLVTMQLTRYENGQVVEAPMKILNKGKIGSFWETPGGSFPITDRQEEYYSEKVGAYLPYTLHLFGNYIIHGVPHDSKGAAYKTTNGGIRLSTENAELLYSWADEDTRVSIFSDSKLKPAIISPESTYVTSTGQVLPRVSAESYIVADIDTGEIILEKNKDVQFPIASVSKLMTALVSLDTLNQFDLATVSKKSTQVYSVNKFTPGEKIPLSSLLYPLLLPSSNVASEIIAEHEDRSTFLANMNMQAEKLHMLKTHFDDPSGLSRYNVSSAYDLFLLTQTIFKEKPFVFNMTLVPRYTASGHTWKNISQFMKVPGYLGGKSGQTDEAKQSNVAVFSVPLSEAGNRTIAIIVLRSNDRYTDTMKILNYVKSRVVYGSTKNVTVTDGNELSSNITLTFGGDIMLDRGVKYFVHKYFNGDFSQLFKNLDIFKKSDLAFANLEGPISDIGTDLHNLYSFRMDPKVVSVLKDAGFDVFSFANNHVGDWGREAFDDTRNRLKAGGIEYVGAGDTKKAAEQPVIKTIKDVKFGFIGFTDVGPDALAATETESGVLLASDPNFETIIANAKKQVDVLVVSFHWGVEYQEHTDHQAELAHKAINAGATLVIGHHPHVPQAIETYKGGLIAYSLGNLIFDQGFSKETMQGLLLQVTFDARSKSFKKYEKYSVQLSPQFQPQTPMLIK
jgi:D-alanyl-D-alanine carboxypeptidase/poly-gamma-glutamate capsule biosynthesis protein CapA/YwtB (metallophosphatase superfamily)